MASNQSSYNRSKYQLIATHRRAKYKFSKGFPCDISSADWNFLTGVVKVFNNCLFILLHKSQPKLVASTKLCFRLENYKHRMPHAQIERKKPLANFCLCHRSIVQLLPCDCEAFPIYYYIDSECEKPSTKSFSNSFSF